MKDTPENRKQLGIPEGSNITFIDLDAQRKPPEIMTAGWTDTQIRNKTIDEIDGMIKQNDLAVASLEQTLATQRNMVHNLQQIRQRKITIGVT
tara:strand:+ start:3701 stop:3979 length:279 start_codon:yes stop_codon:yes gene_type:complete